MSVLSVLGDSSGDSETLSHITPCTFLRSDIDPLCLPAQHTCSRTNDGQINSALSGRHRFARRIKSFTPAFQIQV